MQMGRCDFMPLKSALVTSDQPHKEARRIGFMKGEDMEAYERVEKRSILTNFKLITRKFL